MTSPQLPDLIRPVYGRILRKYKVAFETLKLGESPLHLLQVTDLEPLLKGRDPFRDVSSFPFWIKLWESSMVLAALLAKLPPAPGQTLLELGAGLAAPGLAAAQAGYRVTLSDYEQDILDFARVSAAVNGLDKVDFRLLDWKNPPDLGTFDTIVGAEILFREEFFEPLLAVFDRMLAPGGTIYLSHDMRRKSLPQFLKLAEGQYEIAVSTRKMRSEDETLTVIVNRLRRRG
ncbi:MAG: methyltransferase domain-containing protein [Thermodesulfobacteriota bacterium]